jgi:hypothetical protein
MPQLAGVNAVLERDRQQHGCVIGDQVRVAVAAIGREREVAHVPRSALAASRRSNSCSDGSATFATAMRHRPKEAGTAKSAAKVRVAVGVHVLVSGFTFEASQLP